MGHKMGGLINRNLSFHHFGGHKSEIKGLVVWFLLRVVREDLLQASLVVAFSVSWLVDVI